jgi:hypothetical protein
MGSEDCFVERDGVDDRHQQALLDDELIARKNLAA